jgi:hypothetical protein
MPLKPGEYQKLLVEDWDVQTKGLFQRLLKLYWKKATFIALMLILPGGLLILGLCTTAWVFNWEKEMNAYMEEEYRRWKEEHGIHS